MSLQNIPVVDLRDWHAGGEQQARFIRGVGDALIEIGFFAVSHHSVSDELTRLAYATAKAFFSLPQAAKDAYTRVGVKGQRGYTGFGQEHAKDSGAPDLKEFWQVGRPDEPDSHPVHAQFGANFWPSEIADFRGVMTSLYQGLDALGGVLLQACALDLGEPEATFQAMATDSDTIVRVLYYPPVAAGIPAGAVRSAAHEDINLITLLSGVFRCRVSCILDARLTSRRWRAALRAPAAKQSIVRKPRASISISDCARSGWRNREGDVRSAARRIARAVERSVGCCAQISRRSRRRRDPL